MALRDRIALLKNVHEKLQTGQIRLDPDQKCFGFKSLKLLFGVKKRDVKGYPCLAEANNLQLAVKIIPLCSSHDFERHPAYIEIELLKLFTTLVEAYETPHITHYMFDVQVHNKKRAMTQFPLKSLRKVAYGHSNVLVSEYVNGGSIQEWVKGSSSRVTSRQWKFIVFAIAWTLFILQDRYKFVHGDLHYGNILIDTTIAKKGSISYIMQTPDVPKKEYSIPCCGILPKLWDFEYASAYGIPNIGRNRFFGCDHKSMPNKFDPSFDIHMFLVSILELNIPDALRNYIHETYPVQVIPTDDSDESDVGSDDDSDICTTDSGVSCGTDVADELVNEEELSDFEISSVCSNSSSTSSVVSEYYETDEETIESTCSEHLHGTRLRMGYDKYFKLPTPLDILNGPYLKEFVSKNVKGKTPKPTSEFKYIRK